MTICGTHSFRKPRTIDKLEIDDCIEIIMRDFERYGVPERQISEFLSEYFIPLKRKSYEMKKEYGEKHFRNTPDYAFEK